MVLKHACTHALIPCTLTWVCMVALVQACSVLVHVRVCEGPQASLHVCACMHAHLGVRDSPHARLCACPVLVHACVGARDGRCARLHVHGSLCACSCACRSPARSPGCAPPPPSCTRGHTPHVPLSVPAERLRRHPPPGTPRRGVHGHVSGRLLGALGDMGPAGPPPRLGGRGGGVNRGDLGVPRR